MVKSTSDLNNYYLNGMKGNMFKTFIGGIGSNNNKSIFNKMKKDFYDVKKIGENINYNHDKMFNRTTRMQAIS